MPEQGLPPPDLPDGTEKVLRPPKDPPHPSDREPAWAPWAILLVALVGFMVLVFTVHLPLADERDRYRDALLTARADAEELGDKVDRLSRRVSELTTTKQELESDLGGLEQIHAETAAELAEKRRALEQFKQAKERLSKRLEAEVKRGQVLIRHARGQLVVDLVDKLMFDSAAVELNESGKEVLRKVAETLRELPDKLIMIGGHTDNVPISSKLVDTFPTNWELSTARATGVVRFLQDECKIPPAQLAAVGYSQYRPVASNRNSHGRRRNRRIEVILMPRPKK